MNYLKILTMIFIAHFGISGIIYSQSSYEKEYEKQYEQNIRKPSINGVYIPKDLNDAIHTLQKLAKEEDLQIFKSKPESEIASKLIPTLGRWIIVNWNLYEGSRISHYMKEMGISHPDYMAEFIIISLHKSLNSKDLDIINRMKIMKQRQIEDQKKRKLLSKSNP